MTDSSRYWRTEVEKWWDKNPCSAHHSPEDVNANPQGYHRDIEYRRYKVQPHIPTFADFPRWCGKRVLELGCGIGTDSIYFSAWGADVTGVDISEKSLEIARKRAALFGFTHPIKFIHDNIETLDNWYGEKFDLVYSFGVIHHTPDPIAALASARAFLKKDGELRIMLYHRYSTKMIAGMLRYWRRGRSWDDVARIMSEANANTPITHTYTKQTARRLLERTGFDVLDMKVTHIFPYVVRDYIQFKYRKVWHWPILKILEPWMGWHILIRARVAS